MNKRGRPAVSRTSLEPYARALSDYVREVLQTTGLTQDELADHLDVTQASVSRWGSGRQNIEPENLQALADIMQKHGGPPPPGILLGSKASVNVVGYIGAGLEIFPFDDHAMGGGIGKVPAPTGYAGDSVVAVQVRGESMLDYILPGTLIFYRKTQDGVPDDCLSSLCVVQVEDGPLLLKQIRRVEGGYLLESTNAPTRFEKDIAWASKVIDIRPS